MLSTVASSRTARSPAHRGTKAEANPVSACESALSDEAETPGDADRLQPRVDLELLQATRDVVSDRRATDQQLSADLVGVLSDGEVSKDLELTPGEGGVSASPVSLLVVEVLGDDGKHVGAEDRLDEMHELRCP